MSKKITENSIEDKNLKLALDGRRQQSDSGDVYDEQNMSLIELFNMLDDIVDENGQPIPMLDDSNEPIYYRNIDKEGNPTGPKIQVFQKIRSFDAEQIIKDIPGDFGAYIDRRVDRRAMWCLEQERIRQWFDAVWAKLDTGFIRLVDNQSNLENFVKLKSNPDFISHEKSIVREINEWRNRAKKNKTSP
jgi:hypothetical protein